MSIEIKEMIVKSTIVSDEDTESTRGDSLSADDLEKIKKQLADYCKDYITELLKDRKER